MANPAPQSPGFWRQLSDALMLDLAFVVNQSLLIGEFRLNRAFIRDSTPVNQPPPVPAYRGITSVRILLAITALFAIYGPTLDAICSVTGPYWTGVALQVAGVAALLAGGFAAFGLWSSTDAQVRARIESTTMLAQLPVRRKVFKFTAWFIALALPLAPALVAIWAATSTQLSNDFCYAATPSWGAGLQLILALGAIAAAFVLARPKNVGTSAGWLPLGFFSTLLLLQVAIVVTLGKGMGATEADYLPYLHIYPFVLVLLFAVSLGAKRFVAALLNDFVHKQQSLFASQLTRTELFVKPAELKTLSRPRRYYGLLLAPFTRPLHLLLLPSMVALVVPQVWLTELTIATFAIGYLMLVWGGISRRWDIIIFVVQRYFLQGLPLLISILVIVLGLLRAGDLHYVATLLAVAPFGAVTMIVVMSYSALWLYDFYVNRPLQLKLMELLGAQPGQERIDYRLDSAHRCLHRLDIAPDSRDLQTHSGSWFAVVGEVERTDPGTDAERDIGFRVWAMTDLFERLADSGWCKPDSEGAGPTGGPPAIDSQVSYLLRRVRLYRIGMNAAALALLVACFAGLGYVNGEDKAPLVSADYHSKGGATGAAFSLTERLAEQTRRERPAILLAASGGGTRAALYTYSVLLGLQEQGALDDLVLASGVSGGGVSLAYFAAHHEQLRRSQAVCPEGALSESWKRYRETMAAPFINDVLEGVLELRTFWKTGWSELLEESFSRRFYFEEEIGSQCPNVTRPESFGLIFNTAVTGHPFDDAELTTRLFEGNEDQARQRFYSNLSGARLIFTNLAEASAFPSMNEPTQSLLGQDIHLPYRVVQDAEVCLTQAGTLTANFPPVFPDALVSLRDGPDLDKAKRYKVTDGGATDNRGLISLLLALEHALARMDQEQVPEVHILVADASAFNYDYSDKTRGLGTALSGSKERVGNGLLDRLYRDTKRAMPNGVLLQVHYLAMPTILRSGGGLGTHWMMPEDFKVTDPYDPAPMGFFSELENVDKQQFYTLLDRLYTRTCPTPEPRPGFYDWICRPGNGAKCTSANRHAEQWRELERALSRFATNPNGGAQAAEPRPRGP